MSDLCNYAGIDSTAVAGTRMGASSEPEAYSRCHCGEETYSGQSMADATAALAEHRATESDNASLDGSEHNE